MIMKVKDLITKLEECDPEDDVMIGVYYDKCLHLQYAEKLQDTLNVDWITIIGVKE